MITLLLAAAALAAAPLRAQSTATLRGIDVYRSSALTVDKATALFGGRLHEYVVMRNQHRPAMDQKAEGLRRQLEAEAARTPGVAWVELAMSEHYTSVDHAMYATFDVVDVSDRDRLAFAPAPQGSAPDPDGLLAAWKSYYELGSSLSKLGQMPVDRPDCPGFYCLWGGATPELEALQSRFVVGATAREKDLRDVLVSDADGEKRAEALFVLSYGTRGERVVEACLGGLKDPSPSVRGAALQILADIVNHQPKLRVDAERITPLLDDPSGSVRGKAMGLLVPMVDDADRRKKMMAAGPRLVELVKLHEPENRALAYTLLGLLSRKDYPRDDLAKWGAWAERAAAGKEK